MTELRSVTCHMGSHSVTCHPTLSVIGVEESNADAVGDCSYVKAIV